MNTFTIALAVLVMCAEYGMITFGQNLAYTKLPTSRKGGPRMNVDGMQSPLMCGAYCQQHNQQQTQTQTQPQEMCFSVNYNEDAELCEIATDDQSETVYDPSWVVYLIPVIAAGVKNTPLTSSQSSLNYRHAGNYIPSPNVAIDGNKQSIWASGSCIHTDFWSKEWWMVDFGKEYLVTGIKVFARSDSGHNYRFADIQVLLYITMDHSPKLCATFPGPHLATDSNNPIILWCEEPEIGRFLKIQRTGDRVALDFCEVYFF